MLNFRSQKISGAMFLVYEKNYDTSSNMFSVPILFSTAGCHSPSLSAGGLITEESEGEVARRRILPPLLCLFSLVSRTLNQLWLIMI